MGVERCPTCDQPLPAGLSRAQLLKKVEDEREREISAALTRQRPKMEADLLRKVIPKAKVEARKELQAEIAKARAEGQQEAERTLALERRRRDRAEQTADQLKC